MKEFDCKCGVRNKPARSPINRIVGGWQTANNEYPWQVFLLNTEAPIDEWRCGGSIITSRTILTAAHCLWSSKGGRLPLTSLLVIVGEHDLKVKDGEERHTVCAKNVHPNVKFG